MTPDLDGFQVLSNEDPEILAQLPPKAQPEGKVFILGVQKRILWPHELVCFSTKYAENG